MSQNQEIIEAKLCSYIDGELDAEGKAEIERHLEANPQHRRLLESLKATRDLLRWLPREPSPPELAETLNGQLERSVLLDYDGDSLRPSFLPRLLAAAAIVILTAGLAAAVYFALPKNHGALIAKAHQQEENKTQLAGPAASGYADGEQRDTPSDAGTMAKSAVASLDQAKDTEDLKKVAQQAAQNTTLFLAAASGAVNPTPDQTNTEVVMLVRSAQPDSTEKQLAGYLTTNQIRWQSAEAQQAQQPLGLQQERVFAMKSAVGGQPEPVRKEQATQEDLRGGGTPGDQAAFGRTSPSGNESAPARPGAADTQPAQNPAIVAEAPAPSQGIPQAVPQTQSSSQQVLPQSAGSANWAANYYRGNTLYAARMSRTQARQLQSTISREGATVELRDLAAGENPTDTANLRNAGANSLQEMVADRLRQKLGPTTLPATNPSAVDAQMRRLATPEAGREIQSLARRGIDEKNEPTRDHGAAAEGGLATDGSRANEQVEAENARSTQSATVPASPTTVPTSDEPVNVVILVEPKEETGAAPTTQPDASPPQTQPSASPQVEQGR